MKTTMEGNVSITHEGKENISDRIKSLFKGRSLRKVSLDWDLPYSTLNNYFTRSATPSIDVLVKISALERVSLEWLALGRHNTIIIDEAHKADHSDVDTSPLMSEFPDMKYFGFTGTPLKDEKFMRMTWGMFFDVLTIEEKSKLIDILTKIGTKGVLTLLSNEDDYAEKWLSLTSTDKERLLRLHEQLKKGASDSDSGITESDLDANSKKVG